MTTQTTTTQTPELLNNVLLVGEVFDHELEIKEVTANNVKQNQIMGTVFVRTGENETHRVFIFSRQFTKAGKENGMYAGYVTLKNEMVTVKQIAEDKAPEGVTEPTKLRVSGELGMSEYYVEGKLKSNMQIKGNFLNRVKPEETYEPQAKFDVEGIVSKKRPETNQDGETGRVIVELMIPSYQSPILVDFVAPEEYEGYINDNFDAGLTVNIYGQIINFSKKIVTQVEMGFGDAKPQTTYENVRELVVRGGKVYEEDNMQKTFTAEQREALQVKRNTYLAEQKTKSENKAAGGNKPNGFSGGAPKTPTNGGAKPDVSGMF